MIIATIETHIISAMSLLHLASFLLVSETSEPIGLTVECCSSVATKRTRDMKNVEIHAVVVRFLSSSQEETLKSLQRLFLSLIHSATAPSYEIHLVASRLLSSILFRQLSWYCFGENGVRNGIALKKSRLWNPCASHLREEAL